MPSQQSRNCTFMCVEIPNSMNVSPGASFYVVHIRQILYSVRQDVMPSSLVQLVDFPGALKMAQRILRRGGILLIHEPQISLYSVWEGFQVNDLAPYLAKVSRASANLISSAQWVQLVRGAFAHRGIK